MVRRVFRWCDSARAIRYEPGKRPTVVGPARLGKRFPKSEYRKLGKMGALPTNSRKADFLLSVSPLSPLTCPVTWKLAARRVRCVGLIEIEDLDASMPIGKCD